MELITIALVGLIILALLFDFTNGFHDAANAVAAIVGTKTLPAKYAPAFSAFFNFSAYFVVGTAVANTVAKTVNAEFINMNIIFAGLMSAIMWNYFTWKKGMPSSSSHAILGGLIGAGIVTGGLDAISWSSAQKAALGIAITPFIGFGIAFVIMWIIKLIQQITKLDDNHKIFKVTQLVTSAAVSFGHGANDAQKTMGVIAALLLATGNTTMLDDSVIIPEWVALASYAVIAIGTVWGGWKIIETMGLKMIKLYPNSGAAADIGASVAIFGATAIGMPISTTQAAATSILGAGTAEGSKMDWSIIKRMISTWLITIPSTMAISASVYALTQLPVIFAFISILILISAFSYWAIREMMSTISAKDIEKELETVL